MTANDVLTGADLWSVEQGDAISWLDGLPAGSLQLVFGSPPYQLARLYLEGGRNLGVARKTEEWVAWMVRVFKAALRACNGLVALVVEGQTKQFRYCCGPALLMADLHRAGIHLRKPPIFARKGAPGSGGPDWLANDWEWIICVTNGGKLPWSDNTAYGHPPKYKPGGAMSNRMADGTRVNAKPRRVVCGRANGDTVTSDSYLPPALANPGNILRYKVGGGRMGHPLAHQNEAPFPVGLPEFFINSFCPPNGIVCDPFCGSGSTLHASIINGRRFVGADLRQSQVDLSIRRAGTITPNMF